MGIKPCLFGAVLAGSFAAVSGCKKEPAKASVLYSVPGLPPCDTYNITADIGGSGGAVPAADVPFTAVRCDADSGYLVAKDGGNVPDLVRAEYDASAKSINLRSTIVMAKTGSREPVRFVGRMDLPGAVDIAISALPETLDEAPGSDSGQGQGASLVINHGAVICDFVSVSGSGYKFSRCLQGGKPMAADALIGNVTSVEFRIVSGEARYITTADLRIIHK
jgi:hypothetical protein